MLKTLSAVAPPAKNLRYTIVLTNVAHYTMVKITEDTGLSQAEVIDTLLTKFDRAQWAPIFAAVREAKLGARTSKRAILQRLSKLSTEELAKLTAIADTKGETA
ncbi:hypothetical protein LP414_27665 [Polaromonas sp. P1(28)-13]|nr:hypothetical protein LP414_27665 [Polaromonas sp. P1(28)-13]